MIRALTSENSSLEHSYQARHRIRNLAEVCQISERSVLEALAEVERSSVLEAVDARLATMSWQGTFRAAKELYAIIRLFKPDRVIETGVGSGYSSVHILEALRVNGKGRLGSTDLPNRDLLWKLPTGLRTGFLVPDSLRGLWTLKLLPSREGLPRLIDEFGGVDLFFHDSEHSYENMRFEFETVYPFLLHGGMMVIDDPMWNTSLLDFARQHRVPIQLVYHRGGSGPFAAVRVS